MMMTTKLKIMHRWHQCYKFDVWMGTDYTVIGPRASFSCC